MRHKGLSKLLAALAAAALVFVLTTPTKAESGCHKIKDKGKGVTANSVQFES